MAELDEAFQGGNCIFEGEVNGELHCRPHTTSEHNSGNLYYWFIARLTGANGEQKLCLHWPETTPEIAKNIYGKNHNFATALDNTMFTSVDRKNWVRVTNVQVDGQEVRFSVTTDGRPLYISVGIPYLNSDLQDLYADVAASPYAEVTEIARTPHGRPVKAIAINTGSKESFYIQGMQHASEWAGARVSSSMIRFLLSEEGQEYRERFSWYFVPVVNMDGTIGGLRENFPKNMNRDWVDFEMPEARGVRDYITGLVNSGQRMLYGADMHMGWSARDNSGACLTIYKPDSADERTIQCVEDFTNCVFQGMDYTNRKWYMGAQDVQVSYSFKGWMYTAFHAPAQTWEFSRHLYYMRATGEWVPTEQKYEEALGPEVVKVMANFPWENYR